MATIRDAQIDAAEEAGMTVLSIPNNYHYILITGRDGAIDEPLADPLVRQAIGFAIDRDAYNQAICAGRADANSGIYPPAFAEWHRPDLNDATTFDQEQARELLAEAGYADGLTIQMPLMPAIQPHVELVIQMLAAVGITTEQIQINNGELGPRTRQGEWGITWLRDLLYHPANDLPRFVDAEGTYNVFNLDDVKDLSDILVEAAAASELSEQQELYGQVAAGILERGVQVPLSHCSQNAAWADNVTGVTMGLNMQAPMPFGVRVDG